MNVQLVARSTVVSARCYIVSQVQTASVGISLFPLGVKTKNSFNYRRPRGMLLAPSDARRQVMYNIFYIIGVIVVVLFILGYLGLR